MSPAPGELFAAGSVAGTLSSSLLDDLAEAAEGGLSANAVGLLSHPLLASAGSDPRFFERLDVRVAVSAGRRATEGELAFASLVLQLAEKARWSGRAKLLVKVAEAALDSGRAPLAERLVRTALADEHYTAEPRHMRRWKECLARAAYSLRRFSEALPALKAAAHAALAAGEPRQAWQMLVDAAGCTDRLGDHFEQLRLSEEAIALCERLDDPEAMSTSLGQRGLALMALGRDDEASAVFEAALEAAREAGDERRQSDWWGDLGHVHMSRGQYAEAIRCYERALALSRRLGVAASEATDLHHLAMAHWSSGDLETAIRSVLDELAVRERSGDVAGAENARATLRELYRRLGRIGAAQAVTAESETPPRAPLGLVVSADDYEEPPQTDEERRLDEEIGVAMNRGEVDAATRAVEEFVSRRPASAVGHFLHARLLGMTGRPAEAVAAYRRALERFPRWGMARRSLIGSAQDAGQLEQVLGECEQAVSNEPYDALNRAALGNCHGLLGHWDEALRHLREARRLDPGSYIAARSLAEQLCRNARQALADADPAAGWAAFEECREVLDGLPQLSDSMRGDAYSTAAQCRIEFAMDSSRTAVDMDRLLNPCLRWSRYEMSLLAEALPLALRARQAAPRLERPLQMIAFLIEQLLVVPEPLTLLHAGAALRVAGETALARPLLENAHRYEPSAEACFELGMLLITDDGRDSADGRRLLARALELEPDNVDYQSAARQLAES
jgi:tetratricopeptide (TPR) repeat protein